MKPMSYLAIFLLFALCGSLYGNDSGLFYLDLDRPPPHKGQEFEVTVQYFTTSTETNLSNAQVTNSSSFFTMNGRETILRWDVANDMSDVDLKLKALESGDGCRTNELAAPETEIVGTALLDETFFKVRKGRFSDDAYEQLSKSLFEFRPHFFNEFSRSKIPQPVSVGQTWPIQAPDSLMTNWWGPSFINDTQATASLVGTTNLFGISCFHLQIHLAHEGAPPFLQQMYGRLYGKIDFRISITVDLIVPFDPSQMILLKSYRVEMWELSTQTINGKIANQSQGRNTLNILSEYRPLTP